jgi:tetratricopeptide (TPR) repeat protein
VTVRRTRFFGTARAAIQSAQRFTTVPLAAVAVATLVVAGCSQEKKAISEIRAAYEASEYREAVALCRHAIRRGVDPAEVYYYYGVSLVSMDRDFEGFRQLEIAAEHDPTSARKIAQFLFPVLEQKLGTDVSKTSADEIGAADTESRRDRSGPRPGAVRVPGGGRILRHQGLRKRKAVLREGDRSASRHVRRRGRVSQSSDILCGNGGGLARKGVPGNVARPLPAFCSRKQFVLGNYLETVEVIEELLTRTRNPGLKQKSRFLLGETYEALGEFDNAYQQYRKIIEGDRGASGRIVERAREKIAALREAGLY